MKIIKEGFNNCSINTIEIYGYFSSHDVSMEWVSDVLGKTYEEELVEDILSLMSSFSNKIYGKRSAENRKKKKLAEEQKVKDEVK